MINLNKLPILNDNHEYLIDNPDYAELFERLNYNIEDYIIVYSFIHDIIDVTIVVKVSSYPRVCVFIDIGGDWLGET